MIVHKTSGVPIKAWTEGVPVEEKALQQAKNIASMPFIYKHVALMPDVHWGMGATVGSVIATSGAVIPAACGVDLGCGMIARRLNYTASQLPDNLAAIRSAIEAAVPHGRTDDGGANDRGSWSEPPAIASLVWEDFLKKKPAGVFERHPKALPRRDASTHLGTLGTGNHFIEICLDEEQRVWIMLHSGSRGLGNRIGSYFIELAKADMRKWFVNVPDVDLAYLPEGTEHFDDYIAAVSWAQEYAAQNRSLMLIAAVLAMNGAGLPALAGDCEDDGSAVQCHHNYVAREHHFGKNVIVTRKGAVSAREGEFGIIPGSMGTKSYIVRGKGNPMSFHSCSHGAGRAMSRGEAKRRFTLEDHAAATAGVECRKDAEVLDETPGAYKDVDAVMAAQADLVEVVHTLKQVCCVKG